MLSLKNSLDRTLVLSRLGAGTSNEDPWGGDASDEFGTVIETVPCRFEITDIDQYTVWEMTGVSPRVGDRINISGISATLKIIRVQPWSSADGSFHHNEIVAKPAYPTRTLTDG